MFPVYSIKLQLPSNFVRCIISKKLLKHVILEIQINEKLAVLRCGIIWFQTSYSLRNLGGHLVFFFFITQYFSSGSFGGLLKTGQVLAEPGWNQGSYGWFLLLPAGGSWRTDPVLIQTLPHLSMIPASFLHGPSFLYTHPCDFLFAWLFSRTATPFLSVF